MENKITKRRFLITAATATAAAFAWEPLISLGSTTTVSRRLNLGGAWQVSQAGKEEWIPATVPGCVHTDLLAAGKIPDPFYRDNEKVVQWVTESDWIFRREFDVPAEVLQNDSVLLRCEGLDTAATIKINDREIGRADNMFRLWEFDVKSVLRAGGNKIEITFGSPLAYIKRHEDSAPNNWVKGRAWIRKEPCSFNWDWGPDLASCGIWKAITLETFNQARIADVLVLQQLSPDVATLDIRINLDMAGSPAKSLQCRLDVVHEGKSVSKQTTAISDGGGNTQIEIKHPKFWWPAGMGKQPLYEIRVELLGDGGNPLDSLTKRIGLRELKAVLPQGDNPLHFEVNGVPFFSKGANWIPCDSFTSRITPEILRRYVADAAAVNINTLRFWGGGYYEDDAMFDACDELGICVWLDCKFACSAYPAFDDRFMDNVRHELSDNLRRLRHHPCIAVWCGNNEIGLLNEAENWRDNTMSVSDYDKLFKDLIGQQVQELVPQANYVSGSPDCGDTHYWAVWHGDKTFDAYRTLTGFMSEFGYQSFPELKTISSFTNETDRVSVVTPVMRWHQRSGVGDIEGNQEMLNMILHYLNAPKDFETTLWLSQILQGYGIKIGAEYWRQTMPRSMGCVFWQYNDIWPGMSWSSVDYFGRWKALHYLARKFYSPILVSGLENPRDGTIDIYVTNDFLEPHHGELSWKTTDLAGKVLAGGSFNAQIPSRESLKVRTLALKDQINQLGLSGFLTWLELRTGGKTVSENLVLFGLPKEYKLADPALAAEVHEVDDGFMVTVRSKNPALWVWLGLQNSDASYSDNFVHLLPGAPRRILVRPKTRLDKDDFAQQLQARSLYDTYAPV
ncbi:MAG TPA: glycoside hydrolase family 2 protein [Candidatus Sulfotelmatobacter sp.]|nr:glycoside hydrolase family 2 protein [Candidatus Sulfotelmatobacter sp.]